MENNAFITIRGTQNYRDNPEEVLELTTEGRLLFEDGVLSLSYEETELTGLKGTRTSFSVYPDKIILERTGAVKSRMEFVEGESHKSLYDVAQMGALLISVRTEKIENRLDENGGNLKVSYLIEIEDTGAGRIEYDILVTKM